MASPPAPLPRRKRRVLGEGRTTPPCWMEEEEGRTTPPCWTEEGEGRRILADFYPAERLRSASDDTEGKPPAG